MLASLLASRYLLYGDYQQLLKEPVARPIYRQLVNSSCLASLETKHTCVSCNASQSVALGSAFKTPLILYFRLKKNNLAGSELLELQ